MESEFPGGEVHDTHPEGKDRVPSPPPTPEPPTASEVLGPRGIRAMQGRTEEPGGQQEPGPSFDVTEKPSATEGLSQTGINAMQGITNGEK